MVSLFVYCVLPSFTGFYPFYWALPSFRVLFCFKLVCTDGFSEVLPGFTGFYATLRRVLLIFSQFGLNFLYIFRHGSERFTVVLGFTRFNRVWNEISIIPSLFSGYE